jgi:hypothetical protein
MPADDPGAGARRAQALTRMRGLARTGPPRTGEAPRAAPAERCDICHTTVPDDHRHMLQLVDRRIVCTCEACWALHSGDPEYRPTGMRELWLTGFDCDEETWAGFQIPIGLAFFMRSTVMPGGGRPSATPAERAQADSVVAFYPSPAGATESELAFDSWARLVAANPVLEQLDADTEALVVNRLSEPPQYAILPIDRCYELVGLIKSRWEGISGGSAIERAVPEFFERVRARAMVAS